VLFDVIFAIDLIDRPASAKQHVAVTNES